MKNFGWVILGFLLIAFSCTSGDGVSDEIEQKEENQEEEVITIPIISTVQIKQQLGEELI